MSFDETPLENDQEQSVNIAPPEYVDRSKEIEELKVGAESINVDLMISEEGIKEIMQSIKIQLGKISSFITSKFNLFTNNSFKVDFGHTVGNAKNYLQYSKLKVYKIPSQTCKMITLVKSLQYSYDNVIVPFIKNDLNKTDVLLANLASNPDSLRSVRSGDLINKNLFSHYQSASKELGECFNPADVTTQAEFGDLYERYADYAEVRKILNDINHEIYKVNVDKVVGIIDRMDASLNIIINNISGGYDISPMIVKSLSEDTFQLALLIEYYSAFLYKLREISTALVETDKVIKSATPLMQNALNAVGFGVNVLQQQNDLVQQQHDTAHQQHLAMHELNHQNHLQLAIPMHHHI